MLVRYFCHSTKYM